MLHDDKIPHIMCDCLISDFEDVEHLSNRDISFGNMCKGSVRGHRRCNNGGLFAA